MEQGAKRWLKRTRSRIRSGGGADEVMSYAETMRLEALMEYQRKLSEPVLLNNEVLVSFASRMQAEMEFRAYKTMTTMYSKTFKADEFLLWAIRQEEVRDQTDALFLGNELVSRGVFLPVTYGAADSLYWTPTIKPGNQTHRLVCRTKPQIVAAVLGRDLKVLIEEGGTIAGGPASPTAADSGEFILIRVCAIRLTSCFVQQPRRRRRPTPPPSAEPPAIPLHRRTATI